MKNHIVLLLSIYFSFGIIGKTYPQLYLPGNTSVGPSGDIINDMKISANGEILYATNYGANIYNIDQNKWYNYTITNGVTDINVNTIFRDSKENIWIGTDKGLSKINQFVTVYSSRVTSSTPPEAPHIISTIYKHSSYSTDPNYKPEKWDTVEEVFPTYKEVHQVYIYGNEVSVIFEDRDGRIWVGTDLGLSVLENDKWTVFNQMDGIKLNAIKDIKQTANGNLWIATLYGLIEWDGENAILHWEGKKFYEICIHKNNLLWCGEESFLHQYDGDNWQSWPIEDHASGRRKVLSMDYDSVGNIWCGTNAGVYVFDGNDWINKFESKIGILCDTISSLVINKTNQQIHIGTPKGSSLLKNNIWSPIKRSAGMPSININCIEYDGKNIWGGTNHGLFKINDQENVVSIESSKLINDSINDLSWNNSNLWIATNSGISKLRLQENEQYWTSYLTDTSFSNDPLFIQDEPEYFKPSYYWREEKWARILDNKVYSVDADNKKVWFGTQEGISMFDGLNWKSYDSDPTGGVYHCPINKMQIFEDKIYLASDCGISERYGSSSRYIMNNNKFPYFFNSIKRIGSFYADKKRKLWFTGEGRSKSVSNDEDVTFLYTIFGNTFEINYGKLPLIDAALNPSKPYEIVSSNGVSTAFYFDKLSPMHYDEENKTLYMNDCFMTNNNWFKLKGDNILSQSTETVGMTPFSYYGPYEKQTVFFIGNIQDILTDENGNVWYATTSGLVKHSAPTNPKPTHNNQKYNNQEFEKIKIDNGRIMLEIMNQEIDVTISDLMGRILFQSNATNLHNQPQLSPGIYLISIYNNGNRINKRVLVDSVY